MSITTTTGDEGSTELWSGERVPKDDPRIEACGEVDELSSLLGFARLAARLDETSAALEALQRSLVRVGGEIASIEPAFTDPIRSWDVKAVTEKVLALEARIPIKGFVLPGRTEGAARIDLARTAARRLERRVVALTNRSGDLSHRSGDLSREAPVSDILLSYLNRVSDYLFMLARAEEAAEGKIEYL
ncbi:MAG: cob(I)yrinic acid a,c-diamide adenosyltransferase [Rectinemataceae bacterium]|jgi:ATP:cob(I)alamin adenosyltransferase